MRRFKHVNRKGAVRLATFNRFMAWNQLYESDAQKNRDRKIKNVEKALKRRTLTLEQRSELSGLLAPIVFVPFRERAKKEALRVVKPPEEPETPPTIEKPEEEGGIVVTALVGVVYENKKEPFYGELHATFRFKHKDAYNEKEVLASCVDQITNIMNNWWENSYAVAKLFEAAELLTEGARNDVRYGIISEIEETPSESEIEYTYYVTQNFGKSAVIKTDKVRNLLDV